MDPCLRFYHLLKHVTCTTEHAIAESLKGQSISLAQAMLLLHIHEGARTMSDLSEAMCCSHGNVTQLTNHLLIKKLIRQFPCKEDRRVQHIDLTASGKKLMQSIESHLEKGAHVCIRNLPAGDQKKMERILKKIAA